jgi:hypothetical protein
VLDGRNRLVACKMADVLPEFEDWTVCGSPTEWVLSVNLHRRHLTQSQKAAVATQSLPLFEKENEELRRQKISASRKGETVPILEPSQKSRDKAAKVVGVSPAYVSDAKAIKEASPETFQKVLDGEMTIPEAKKSIFKKDRVTTGFEKEEPKDQTEPGSPALLQLKIWWNRATKKDKRIFLEYAENH